MSVTIAKIIEYVDGVKPNAYTDDDKLGWINEMEYAVQTDVLNKTADFDVYESVSDDVSLGDEWSELYKTYLEARIARANGEWAEYANLMIFYNEVLGRYLRWYDRNYIDTD